MTKVGKVSNGLGEPAVTAEPREDALDDPSARQDIEAFLIGVVLDDLDAQDPNCGNRGLDLVRVFAGVRPHASETGKALADLVAPQDRAVAAPWVKPEGPLCIAAA